MDSFQVTLPSNASGKTFPQNRAAHYETDLMSPIHLEGPWEVALIDVMYPHTWNNLSKTIKVRVEYGEYLIEKYTICMTGDFEIKPQYFETPEIFCQRMNKWSQNVLVEQSRTYLHEEKQVIRFTYDSVDDRISISSDVKRQLVSRLYLCFDEKAAMQRMLGIDTKQQIRFDDGPKLHSLEIDVKKGMIAERPPLFDSLPLMFLYTNLIEYQLIGDVKAPILAVLPVSGQAGEMVYWNCNPQSFLPVAKSEINTVEIRLCTETGETFPIIGNGKVITRLNFRRRLV